MFTELINVSYASNEKYYKYAKISLYSLLDHNKDNKIRIVFIDCGLSANSRLSLKEMVESFGQQIEFERFDEISQPLPYNLDKSPLMARHFLVNVSYINKVLYIDCDTIILDDIATIWEECSKSSDMVAGCIDILTKEQRVHLGLHSEDQYINSGVLFLNLQRLRDMRLIDEDAKYLSANGIVPLTDQTLFNILCRDHIHYLSPRCNLIVPYFLNTKAQFEKLYDAQLTISSEEYEYAKIHPVIVHYAGHYQSLTKRNDVVFPFRDEYYYYAQKAGFDEDEYIIDGHIALPIKLMRVVRNMLSFNLYCKLYHLYKKNEYARKETIQ